MKVTVTVNEPDDEHQFDDLIVDSLANYINTLKSEYPNMTSYVIVGSV